MLDAIEPYLAGYQTLHVERRKAVRADMAYLQIRAALTQHIDTLFDCRREADQLYRDVRSNAAGQLHHPLDARFRGVILIDVDCVRRAGAHREIEPRRLAINRNYLVRSHVTRHGHGVDAKAACALHDDMIAEPHAADMHRLDHLGKSAVDGGGLFIGDFIRQLEDEVGPAEVVVLGKTPVAYLPLVERDPALTEQAGAKLAPYAVVATHTREEVAENYPVALLQRIA